MIEIASAGCLLRRPVSRAKGHSSIAERLLLGRAELDCISFGWGGLPRRTALVLGIEQGVVRFEVKTRHGRKGAALLQLREILVTSHGR